jgi:hypothetical protein
MPHHCSTAPRKAEKRYAIAQDRGTPQGKYPMELKDLIKQGLLGYQPIFLPNGVVTGTGLQFFGNLRAMRAASTAAETAQPEKNDLLSLKTGSNNFNFGRLGNLYVPPELGQRSEFDSEFYYCVDETQLEIFAKYNIVLSEMYRYFAFASLEISASRNCHIESMMEVGSNTCLFPLAFAEAGVKDCHGSDIVNYSPVVDLLSALKSQIVTFHHMADDSDSTWKTLPKADLVWSYAVVLHQSNPLAHLTRLASLATKVMFVMTLCEPDDWRTENEMGLRYLSANSYYNADFPNCFDVTVVSPELLKYSLKRLGFSQIVEVPHPEFKYLDQIEQDDLEYWMKKHCFFLAFRDAPLSASALSDYSVSSERNPYKGENVLVHTGFHNNVVLAASKYFIVPQGVPFDPANNDFSAFSSLTNAMQYFADLADEKSPYPITLKSLKHADLVRFKNRVYFSPHSRRVDFQSSGGDLNLHVLDSLEKWDALLALVGENGLDARQGLIVDFIDGICILMTPKDTFHARRIISRGSTKNSGVPTHIFGDAEITSDLLEDVLRAINVKSLLRSMTESSNDEATLCQNSEGRALKRVSFGEFHIKDESCRESASSTDDAEGAWKKFLGIPDIKP